MRLSPNESLCRLARHKIGRNLRDPLLHVLAVHDHVDHAMGEEIFGALKAFRQLFPDRVLDHPLPCKPDQGVWLGDLDIAKKIIGSEQQLPGDLAPADKMKELLVFSVSEEYSKLRQALGITIGV